MAGMKYPINCLLDDEIDAKRIDLFKKLADKNSEGKTGVLRHLIDRELEVRKEIKEKTKG